MVQALRALQGISLLLVAVLTVFFFSSLYKRRPPVEEEASTREIVGVDADECFPEEDDVAYKMEDFDAINSSSVEPPPVPDPYTINVTIPNVLMSTCSDEATSRGPHQKVIAFIFYGKINCGRKYFEGIEENILLAEKLYPGWIIRVYYELYEPVEHAVQLLADLQDRYGNLDLCNGKDIPGYGNLEAGMWGVRVHQARELLFSLTMQMFIRGRVGQRSFFDQSVLRIVVWPVIKGHVMQHDSYYCEGKFAEHGNMRPFPTRRIANESSNYIGSNVLKSVVMDYPCPVACRPPKHRDWTTC